MGAFALPMLGKITVETQHLETFRIALYFQPSVEDSSSTNLFPVGCPLAVHVVYSKEDGPVLPATRALNLPVRGVVREHVEFQG